MNVYMTKAVKRWLKKQSGLTNAGLRDAACEVADGLYEADLGGHLFKKRIASVQNQGKSGGSRAIVAFKVGNDVFVLYGFGKNERDNITIKEKDVLKLRAKMWLSMSVDQLSTAIKSEDLIKL